jgi:5-methylcytosine-specific restriction endonuclease McrA
MNILKTIKFLIEAKHEHFISVDYKTYKKWKYLIKLVVCLNKNYKYCEIHRKKFKLIEDFVVIGLKYSGKNVKRRTSGYAKDFLNSHDDAKCLYCQTPLTYENATADHIVPISNGGNNTQVNLIVCCKSCNGERGNIEFRKYLSIKNDKYRDIKFI